MIQERKIKIPGPLESVSRGGYVATSADIVEGDKTQAQINFESSDAIDLLQTEVAAINQSKVVPCESLPDSNIQTDTIYRLSGDGSYSDYMYRNGSWIELAEYDNAIDDTPTPNSNNLVKSGGVYEATKIIGNAISTTDLDISDNDENVLVRFSNGHVKTKNFDSSETATESKNGLMSFQDKEKLNSVEVGAEVNDVEIELLERYGDLGISDENGNAILLCSGGNIRTKNFNSKEALERLSDIENTLNSKKVYCIGDSITQGQTGLTNPTEDIQKVNRYPEILQGMLGNSAEVVNLGVGGQKPNEIFARNGLLDLVTTESFTLLGNGSNTVMASLVGSYDLQESNYIMRQGVSTSIAQMKYAYINGIKCEFSRSNDVLYVKRLNVVSYDVLIPSGSHVTFVGKNGDGIYLFYVGTNGDLKNDADLFVGEVKAATANVIGGKYLVLGLFTPTTPNKAKFNAINTKLSKEFGAQYIDPSYMWSQQAFDELGITPTQDADISAERYSHGVRSDVSQMAASLTPSTFWRASWTPNFQNVDGTHLDELGYTLMARMFYNKIVTLNWI